MNDIDRLKTLARILLSALEENQQSLDRAYREMDDLAGQISEADDWDYPEPTEPKFILDQKEDNDYIIRQAHEVLLDFPA